MRQSGVYRVRSKKREKPKSANRSDVVVRNTNKKTVPESTVDIKYHEMVSTIVPHCFYDLFRLFTCFSGFCPRSAVDRYETKTRNTRGPFVVPKLKKKNKNDLPFVAHVIAFWTKVKKKKSRFHKIQEFRKSRSKQIKNAFKLYYS